MRIFRNNKYDILRFFYYHRKVNNVPLELQVTNEFRKVNWGLSITDLVERTVDMDLFEENDPMRLAYCNDTEYTMVLKRYYSPYAYMWAFTPNWVELLPEIKEDLVPLGFVGLSFYSGEKINEHPSYKIIDCEKTNAWERSKYYYIRDTSGLYTMPVETYFYWVKWT